MVVNMFFRIYWFLFRIIVFLTWQVKNTIISLFRLFSLPESTQNRFFKQIFNTDFIHRIYINFSIIYVYLFATTFGLTTNFRASKAFLHRLSRAFWGFFICGSKKMHFLTPFSDIFSLKISIKIRRFILLFFCICVTMLSVIYVGWVSIWKTRFQKMFY